MSTTVSGAQLQNFAWVERTKAVLVLLVLSSVAAVFSFGIKNPLLGWNGFTQTVLVSYILDGLLAVVGFLALRFKNRFLLLPLMIKKVLEIVILVFFAIFAVKYLVQHDFELKWRYSDGILMILETIVPIHIAVFYCCMKCYKVLSPNQEHSPIELANSKLVVA